MKNLNWDKIFDILKKRDLKFKLGRAVSNLYKEQATVIMTDEEHEEANINKREG